MARMQRRLELADMDAAALVHRAAFDDALPWLAGLHTPADDRRYFRERVFTACEVWGAFDDAVLAALVAFREGWIDQLYVLPAYQGRGVATIVRGIEVAVALVRVEASRQCRDAGRPLDADLLLEGFRGADFILNHLAVGEDLAKNWSRVES